MKAMKKFTLTVFLHPGRLALFSFRYLDLFSEKSGQSRAWRRGACGKLSETLSDDLQ